MIAILTTAATLLRRIPKEFLLAGMIFLSALSMAAAAHSIGVRSERHRWQAKEAREAAELALRKGQADGVASLERTIDLATVATNKEARDHAISSAPDSAPSAVRRRLNCERLRQAAPARRDIPGC